MPSGYIDIKSSDGEGEFKAYFTSRPYLSDLPRPPGIVIIQEIFGISPFLKEMANRYACLLYTSPSPRDLSTSRMPSSA